MIFAPARCDRPAHINVLGFRKRACASWGRGLAVFFEAMALAPRRPARLIRAFLLQRNFISILSDTASIWPNWLGKVVGLRCNHRKRFEGQLLSPSSLQGAFRCPWIRRFGGVAVLDLRAGGSSRADGFGCRTRDGRFGGNPVCEEIAGLTAARWAMCL